MRFEKSTRAYERWLRRHIALVNEDLDLKHTRMAEAIFPFFRATFYRWAQTWSEVCPDLASAPAVLAVGDLHVENFGTWRDPEGRLVWGINDFDEAYPLPYTNDLLRLATSSHLAFTHPAISLKDACEAILAGYAAALDGGGEPFVLEEKHAWLRETATGDLRDSVAFWNKLGGLPPVAKGVPKTARKALARMMPERDLAFDIFHRSAGMGSLGRQRFVAVANWCGGKVAREAKTLAPSACTFAKGDRGSAIHYADIIAQAVRVPDPFLRVCDRWIVRRLAPHCTRIELDALPKVRDEKRLLHAMGFETANIHLGTPKARKRILRDLAKRKAGWLAGAVRTMANAVQADWRAWRKR
jgi:Uncharacterized protein conserved in bacteria (DUF2252)